MDSSSLSVSRRLAAGVKEVVRSALPGLRGVHAAKENGRYSIELAETEWEGAKEPTLLHEAYEIVHERLRALYPDLGFPTEKQVCDRADWFGAAVLIQPRMFAPFAESTGFDVVALQRQLRRAYASLTLRLGEVMRHQPLLAALYARREHGDPQDWVEPPSLNAFRASVVVRTPGFRVRTRRRPRSILRGLLPRRGSAPCPGSVVERVMTTGRPVFVERVTGYDLWGVDDLTVAARPVRWKGKLARVAVIAVPYTDRFVLSPQLDSARFDRVAQTHQVI